MYIFIYYINVLFFCLRGILNTVTWYIVFEHWAFLGRKFINLFRVDQRLPRSRTTTLSTTRNSLLIQVKKKKFVFLFFDGFFFLRDGWGMEERGKKKKRLIKSARVCCLPECAPLMGTPKSQVPNLIWSPWEELFHYLLFVDQKTKKKKVAFTEKDKLCLPVPMYHCFGDVLGFLACATTGASIVFP